METFHIINQIPKNLIPVRTGFIETYLGWAASWNLGRRKSPSKPSNALSAAERRQKLAATHRGLYEIPTFVSRIFYPILLPTHCPPSAHPSHPDPEYISPSHSTQVFLGIIYSLNSRCRVVQALDLIDTSLFFLPKDDCTKLVSWLLNRWLLIVLSDKFLLLLFFRICI